MGEQQGFLCAQEKRMRRDGERFRACGGAPMRMPKTDDPACLARLVNQFSEMADHRVAEAIRREALAMKMDVAVMAAMVRVQLPAEGISRADAASDSEPIARVPLARHPRFHAPIAAVRWWMR